MSKLKEVKNKVKKSIDNDAMPWLKNYENLGYRETLDYPECTIYELLEKTIKEYPNYDAYEYFGKKATFEEFNEKIKRCAQSLLKIGVTPDDTVTILMPNTPEGIIAFYACNMIGAVASMVHPLSSEAEIEFCMNKAKSNYILTLNALYDKLHAIKDKVEIKKIILARVNESMPPVISTLFWATKGRKIKIENKFEDNVIMWKDFIYEGRETSLKRSKKADTELAVILFSGGTTGTSKGVMQSSRSFNVTATQLQEICPDAEPGKSILSILPIFHVFGLGVCFHTVLCAGMKAIVIPKFTPEDFPKLIKNHKPNFIAGVPTLYEALVQSEFPENGLACVEIAICGGDLLNEPLQKKVNKFFKDHGSLTEIRVGWGMTECCVGTATAVGNFKPGSIGVPSPDVEVKIVKPGTIDKVDFDEDGELCVSGPILMIGYLDEKEETANALKTHNDGKVWLHTGDMASMDKDGMIFFKSRIKRMIISSGYNIYPSVVESVLNSHPKVATSIVIGEPDDYKGEIPKAFVVLKPEWKDNKAIKEELMELCKKNLSKYMWPTSIEFREELPVTKIGKADYRNVK